MDHSLISDRVCLAGDGQTAGGLAAQNGARFGHTCGDVLKAHRHFHTGLAEGSGNGVQPVCGGQIAYHRAFPALVLHELVVEHTEYLVGADVAAVFVDDTKAVAVAVHGDTHIVVAVDDALAENGEALLAWGRHKSAKVGIFIEIDGVHSASGGVEDYHKRVTAGAVHWVEENAKSALTEGVHIEKIDNVIDKLVEWILAVNNKTVLYTGFEVNGVDLSLADVLLKKFGGLEGPSSTMSLIPL